MGRGSSDLPLQALLSSSKSAAAMLNALGKHEAGLPPPSQELLEALLSVETPNTWGEGF